MTTAKKPLAAGEPERRRVLRVTHVLVQPVLVYDDGDNLTPGPATQPVQVALTDLPGLPAMFRADLDAMNTVESGGA